jgi:AbiV family abortive infection protein
MIDISVMSLTKLAAAALANAEGLLQEASALLSAGHHARAYLLAVASIEEVGKAAIAFNAAGRNLSDQKVAKAVRKKVVDHKSKIISAFAPSLQLTDKTNLPEAIEATMGLIGDLRRGREPSMYTEILSDGSVRTPSEIVRPVAASDVVRLAQHCLIRAQNYIPNSQPPSASAANDFVYTQSTAKLREIMDHEQFSGFYLDRIKSGSPDLEQAMYAFFNRSVAH